MRASNSAPELGIAYLPYNALELPTQCAWTESGAFDTHGHDEGARLAWRVNDELASLQVRIAGLLQAGWKTVKVVTDHGWLLLPGGLPKAERPSILLSRGGADVRLQSQVRSTDMLLRIGFGTQWSR